MNILSAIVLSIYIPVKHYWYAYFLCRMTEQEEDEELLSDLNTAKKTVISFDESPNYVKVGGSAGDGFEFRPKLCQD